MTSRMQIGEVAERTGLSLRTIRYYGEVGLVTPSSRTEGGFRLYTEGDVAKLEVVKKLKPLEYTLEEMSEVLAVLAELDGGPARSDDLAQRLAAIRETATARRDRLAEKLAAAESFVAQLDEHAGRGRPRQDSNLQPTD